MFHQCLSFFVGFRTMGDPFGIGLNMRGILSSLYDLPVVLGRGTFVAHRAVFASLGLILFEMVISCFVPGAITGQGVSLGAGIAIILRVIVEVLGIVKGVGSLTSAAYGRDGHQGINAQGVGNVKLAARMVAFVVECSEELAPRIALVLLSIMPMAFLSFSLVSL